MLKDIWHVKALATLDHEREISSQQSWVTLLSTIIMKCVEVIFAPPFFRVITVLLIHYHSLLSNIFVKKKKKKDTRHTSEEHGDYMINNWLGDWCWSTLAERGGKGGGASAQVVGCWNKPKGLSRTALHGIKLETGAVADGWSLQQVVVTPAQVCSPTRGPAHPTSIFLFTKGRAKKTLNVQKLQ